LNALAAEKLRERLKLLVPASLDADLSRAKSSRTEYEFGAER